MGNSGAKDIKVATLNYSGITLSPFEFVSESNELEMKFMNTIFIRLLFLEKYPMFQSTPFAQLINPSITDRWDEGRWKDKLTELTAYIKKQVNANPNETNERKKLWSIGQIDKHMHKERYTPLYRRDVGILNGISFIQRGSEEAAQYSEQSSRTFIGRWKKEYTKNERYVNFRAENTPTEDQKRSCRVFDYLVYKTLVEFCYLNKDGKPENKTIKNAWTAMLEDRKAEKKEQRQAVRRYEQLLETYFRKPYLKQEKKVERVLEIFKEHDVVFLQDVSSQLINSLKNERNINIITAQEGDCAILIKQNKFKVLYDEQKVFDFLKKNQSFSFLHYENFIYNRTLSESGKSQIKKQDLKRYTAICFVDNYLLVSLHLTSSSKNRENQAKLVFKHLNQIKSKMPHLKIIVGGDFNFFAKQTYAELTERNADKINIYPTDSKEVTTKKQRSWLQPQIAKSEVEDTVCRDFLLSSHKMYQTKLSTYSSGLIKSASEKLPSQEHPFDHYIVSAVVQSQ